MISQYITDMCNTIHMNHSLACIVVAYCHALPTNVPEPPRTSPMTSPPTLIPELPSTRHYRHHLSSEPRDIKYYSIKRLGMTQGGEWVGLMIDG